MAQYWRRHWPKVLGRRCPRPLQDSKVLSRDGTHGDFQLVKWKELLSGEAGARPSLDLERSQVQLSPTQHILRDWDVDSFLARANSLAVHRGGFSLSYYPPFLRRTTQNPYVKFGAKNLHEYKNQRLGNGLAAGGYGYDCHVFFPRMEIRRSEETHLTDEQQAYWIDQILLPAMRVSVSPSVQQHHPRSAKDVFTKAAVKKENNPSSKAGALDFRAELPEECLEQFWTEVMERCRRPENIMYGNCFLLISGHNLKLHTKRRFPTQARDDFLEHLDQVFHMDEHLVPSAWCWLDIGIEETPTSEDPDVGGLTLIRKRHCCLAWADKFSAPSGASKLTRAHAFPWNLTRDGGSNSVEVLPTNPWHEAGRIAYNKAYNLNKDQFATPLKTVKFFNNSQYEGLAYTQDTLNQWYELNNHGGLIAHPHKRKQLVESYEAAKVRLHTALTSSQQSNFGARQEYRIGIALFRALSFEDESEANVNAAFYRGGEHPCIQVPPLVGEDSGHYPYYILETNQVNGFVALEAERWLLCLEALMSQATSGIGLPPVSVERQLANGVMASAVLRTLQASLGAEEEERQFSLWRASWELRHLDQEAEVVLPDESRQRTGLNYRDCIANHGMAWLPLERVLWHGLPTFSEEVIATLGLARNGFGRRMRGHPDVLRRLTKQNREFSLYQTLLDDAPNHAPAARFGQKWVQRLGAELVVQQYILDVYALLRGRFENTHGVGSFLADADAYTQQGLRGLCYESVRAIILEAPHIVLVKGASRNGKSLLDRYFTGLWWQRLAGLHSLDDHQVNGLKQRAWERNPFREKARKLVELVRQTGGPNAVAAFGQDVVRIFREKLWIVPQYDIDKLSVLRKASRHNAVETQERLKELTDLSRTNWTMPQLPRLHWGRLREVEIRGEVWDGMAIGSTEPQETLHQFSIRHGQELRVLGEGALATHQQGCPKQPAFFGRKLLLERAVWFREQLEAPDAG